MSETTQPPTQDRDATVSPRRDPGGERQFEPEKSGQMDSLVKEFASGITSIVDKVRPEPASPSICSSSTSLSEELHAYVEIMAKKLQSSAQTAVSDSKPREPHAAELRPFGRSSTTIAENMEQSIAALGPALADIETPVSPQLARSMAATENAWRELETEFGLLTSLEVSKLVGSAAPNRSYASEQRSRGKMIAVKRPGGLRYPGFQVDRDEHTIRPVMADLIRVAQAAGRSEASLALWMTSRTGYLDGARPVDHLSQPGKVVGAAEQSFGVQW